MKDDKLFINRNNTIKEVSMKKLKEKNAFIKTLRLRLRQAPGRSSISELDDILSSITDKKAFILLMDAFETEKEITRELLEQLIDHSFEMNEEIIDYLENEINLAKGFADVFAIKNIKSILIFAVALGIILSIASHPQIAAKLLNNSPIPVYKEEENK